MRRPGPWEAPAIAVLFSAYCAVTSIAVRHHEPWRDEADTWLQAREASLADIVSLAGHNGTPTLWCTLLKGLALAGLPYEAQAALHLVLAWVVAALVLMAAPFPLWTRAALVGSYALGFEYAVVARNYALGIALLFGLAACDARRWDRPVAYGLGLALLAHTSAHFLVVTAGLVALWAWETARDADGRARLPGLLVAAAGVALSAAAVWPRAGGQLPAGVTGALDVPRFLVAVSMAFVPQAAATGTGLGVSLLCLGLIGAVGWFGDRRGLAVLALCLGAFLYVFGVKYFAGYRHAGLIVAAAVYALWIGAAGGWSPLSVAWERRELRSGVFHAAFLAVAVASAASAVATVRDVRREVARPFSEGRAMAELLRERGLEGRPIAAHQAPHASAVLAHLPPGTRFWYAGTRAWGTHMWWDRAYFEGLAADTPEVVARVREGFAEGWEDPERRPLLLLNHGVPDPGALGLELVYRTPGDAWWATDETFWLYRFTR